MTLTVPPICPYCSQPSVYCESSEHVHDGKNCGPIYFCEKDQAWVGVHPGKERKPRGRLANAELRAAKRDAHAAVDARWKKKSARGSLSKGQGRAKTYAWLAQQLGVPLEQAHIGSMDLAGCRRVIEICRAATMRKAA